jgi:hypothetical protein
VLSVIEEEGAELLRRMKQAYLDELFVEEQRDVRRWKRPAGSTVRSSERGLETQFGRVRVRRHGLKEPGQPTMFPMDAALNLPPEVYALSLRERLAEETADGSFGRSVERVESTTAGAVPKRQAEQLAVRAATDFESFYAGGRSEASNDTVGAATLLVLSTDGKGVTMRPEALRTKTREKAEAAATESDGVKGDPMASRKERRHDKRMAVVTAVYDVEPHVRTAKEVAAALGRKRRAKYKRLAKAPYAPKPPRPINKRVWASVTKGQTAGIAEMFDEADRRDPDKTRKTAVLVDGAEGQRDAIRSEAAKRRRPITLVLDLIHVLHYVWLMGALLFEQIRQDTEREKQIDAWVTRIVLRLLTRHPGDVISHLEKTALEHGLSNKKLAKFQKHLDYLRKNADSIHYALFLAAGLPIATGVIEGACRHLIQDRLGITGARWSLAGAEAILKIRALRTSGDWDEYWRFHQKQELARNHAQAPVTPLPLDPIETLGHAVRAPRRISH